MSINEYKKLNVQQKKVEIRGQISRLFFIGKHCIKGILLGCAAQDFGEPVLDQSPPTRWPYGDIHVPDNLCLREACIKGKSSFSMWRMMQCTVSSTRGSSGYAVPNLTCLLT